MPNVPVDLMWLACAGGACYFGTLLADLIKSIVEFVFRKVARKKAKKEIDTISVNLDAEVNKLLNQIGKEVKL